VSVTHRIPRSVRTGHWAWDIRPCNRNRCPCRTGCRSSCTRLRDTGPRLRCSVPASRNRCWLPDTASRCPATAGQIDYPYYSGRVHTIDRPAVLRHYCRSNRTALPERSRVTDRASGALLKGYGQSRTRSELFRSNPGSSMDHQHRVRPVPFRGRGTTRLSAAWVLPTRGPAVWSLSSACPTATTFQQR